MVGARLKAIGGVVALWLGVRSVEGHALLPWHTASRRQTARTRGLSISRRQEHRWQTWTRLPSGEHLPAQALRGASGAWLQVEVRTGNQSNTSAASPPSPATGGTGCM